MPYDSNDKLPDDVKNALPDDAQTIWRNAFNSAADQNDEDEAARIAWTAVKNAGFEKGDDNKWRKNNSHEFEAEIFSAGTWNGDSYTESDLDDIVMNFDLLKNEIKPPIKLGHKFAKFGEPGKISLGWVKSLKRNGDKLIAQLSQVPGIVFHAIQNGLYKRISSEIYWDLKKDGRTHKRVLAAVALLGADIPAVTNLADLGTYLDQSTVPGTGSFDRIVVYEFNMDSHKKIIRQEDDMDQKDYETKLADEKTKREQAEAKAKEYKTKLDAEHRATAEKTKKDRFSEFKTFCEDQVNVGKMTPAARDALCDAKHVYSDEVGISIDFDAFKAFMEKQGKVLPTKEKSHAAKKSTDATGSGQYDDAGTELDARARQYAAEHKIEYAHAVNVVLNDDADLAERYREEYSPQ